MPRSLLLLLLGLAGFVLAAAANGSPSPAAEPLHVGVAEVDITPPVPYRMSGYFYERLSTGVHDPLKLKALYLRQGEVEAALVFTDLIGLPRALSAEARRAAAEQTGVPAEHILLSATHSHTGPLYAGTLRDYFHEQALARSGADELEREDYPARLQAAVVEAISAAQAAAAPAELAAGTAEQLGLSFNRRFHMKDGAVRFNPGRRNPDIVRVAGPIDPEVGLLCVRDGAGRPRAALSVFALHLDTVGGTEYSADYPHYLAESLQKEFGEEFVSLFGAGTCGDINHIDVTAESQPTGQDNARQIGERLAGTVRARLAELPAEAPSLAVRAGVLEAERQHYSAERLEQARADFPKIGGRELSFLEQVETYKIVAVSSLPERLPVEVQAFRLGPQTAVVGLPGEVFVELGLAIKDRSPFATTLVMELCNDSPGYLPTRKAFAEGSYETVNSRIAPGEAEKMVDLAVKLLEELHAP